MTQETRQQRLEDWSVSHKKKTFGEKLCVSAEGGAKMLSSNH